MKQKISPIADVLIWNSGENNITATLSDAIFVHSEKDFQEKFNQSNLSLIIIERKESKAIIDIISIIQKIRSLEKTKETPILVIFETEMNENEIAKLYQFHFIDHLTKPLDPLELIKKIDFFNIVYKEKLKSEYYKEKYEKILLNTTDEGVVTIDQKGIIQFSNPAAESLLGYGKNQLDGKSFESVWGNDSAKRSRRVWENHQIDKLCRMGKTVESEKDYFVNKKEGIFPVKYKAMPVFEKDEYAGAVVVFDDITQKLSLEKKMLEMSLYDPLTGLMNRAYFKNQLDAMIERSKRTGIPFSVLFIDLDNFKHINDGYGHATGDHLLIDITQRIKKALRESDMVARIGGDEFIVILEGAKTPKDACDVAEKIKEAVAMEYSVDKNIFYTSVSIGIAGFPDSSQDAQSLIQNADTAMYAAKHFGKNRVVYFKDEMSKNAKDRISIENNLREAIVKNQFLIFFQPQLNLLTHEIIGFEILIRWNHPTLGFIPPLKFIPISEESGMISDITYWVIKATNEQIALWKKKYPEEIKKLKFSINISPYLVGQKKLVESFFKIIKEYKNDPTLFTLEITESGIIKNISSAGEMLKEFSSAGISISIDDFGTGYSSLYQLKKLSVDYLKIDKGFVNDLFLSHGEDAEIVNAIIQLAKNLKLGVIAEGIETKEQLDYVRNKGCSIGQGFYFSEAKSIQETEKLFQNGLFIKK